MIGTSTTKLYIFAVTLLGFSWVSSLSPTTLVEIVQGMLHSKCYRSNLYYLFGLCILLFAIIEMKYAWRPREVCLPRLSFLYMTCFYTWSSQYQVFSLCLQFLIVGWSLPLTIFQLRSILRLILGTLGCTNLNWMHFKYALEGIFRIISYAFSIICTEIVIKLMGQVILCIFKITNIFTHVTSVGVWATDLKTCNRSSAICKRK